MLPTTSKLFVMTGSLWEMPYTEQSATRQSGVLTKHQKLMTRNDLPDKPNGDVEPHSGISDSEQNPVVSLVRQDFAGPLPHPSILAGYNQVLPGSAERILVMAEKQLDHRINTESLIAHEQMKQSSRGQHYALFVCTLALAISATLAMTGHEVTAAVIGGLDLIGLATVFVVGRIFSPKNNEKESSEQE